MRPRKDHGSDWLTGMSAHGPCQQYHSMTPLHISAGVSADRPTERPCSSQVLQAYQATPGVDFADIKLLSVKFLWGSEPQKTPQPNFWGSKAMDFHGISAYDKAIISHGQGHFGRLTDANTGCLTDQQV